ncbi:hypothetical protein [Maricaulis sp.]|uniref:hypothetical protein n=1 Tax=Maricaulis sp. TaxID=1486257 RepID=UPI0026306119|nr:hypothetical protein [Maricaulis sp.]MDF1769457.1 hypothetical protein [Maricaulis sp.]
MSAATAKVTLENGLQSLHCPACGVAMLDEDLGLAEDLCPHVIAVIDWLGEFQAAAGSGEVMSKMETIVDRHFDNVVDGALLSSLAECMSASGLVIEFEEPSRGGGHDGSSVTFMLDFNGAG